MLHSNDMARNLLSWLTERHNMLKELESKAQKALWDNGDEVTYRTRLCERAQSIVRLEKEACAFTQALPESLRATVEQALCAFAQGARTALALDSLFYMSALLYPDEHKKGEPDKLELLMARLAGNPADSL